MANWFYYLTHRISDEWATGQETCAYVATGQETCAYVGLFEKIPINKLFEKDDTIIISNQQSLF